MNKFAILSLALLFPAFGYSSNCLEGYVGNYDVISYKIVNPRPGEFSYLEDRAEVAFLRDRFSTFALREINAGYGGVFVSGISSQYENLYMHEWTTEENNECVHFAQSKTLWHGFHGFSFAPNADGTFTFSRFTPKPDWSVVKEYTLTLIKK